MNKEDTEKDEDDLFREREEGSDCEEPEIDVAGREDSRGEVGGDDRKSNYQNDLQAISIWAYMDESMRTQNPPSRVRRANEP